MPIDMTQAVTAPPRKRQSGVRTTAPKVQADTRSPNEKRVEGLLGLGQVGQAACIMGRQYADAATLGMHFPPVATEIANLADQFEMVANVADFLIQIGPFTAIITASMPLILQLLANHKVLDASALMGQGVVPPEVLESQMKAQIAKMQADAMREQQMAMQEAREAQAEYERYMAENAEMNVERADHNAASTVLG